MLKTNLNTDQNELIQYLNVKPEDINQKEVAKLLTPLLSLASAGTEISLQVKKEGEFLIPKGTPLAVYIPYKRQKYDFECITQTEELRKRTHLTELSTATKFIKRFRNIKDIISGDK